MFEDCKKSIRIVNSKKLGSTFVTYDRVHDRLGDGYIVYAKKNGRLLTGYMDINNRLIIDLNEMFYDNYYIKDESYNDMCIFFIVPAGYDIFFHIKKIDNKYHLVMKTDPKDPLNILPVPGCDKYWLYVSRKNDKYTLYDIENVTTISTTFDKFEIVNSDVHRFLFEKDILYTFEGKINKIGTIRGFLDENANVSSDILLLNSNGFKFDGSKIKSTLSIEFNKLIQKIVVSKIRDEFLDMEIDKEATKELFNNPKVKNKSLGIIINFSDRKKV